MILFVDASAMVSIVANESDRPALAEKMSAAEILLCSAMSCWETISALRRSHGYDIEIARTKVRQITEAGAFKLVEIGQREMTIALDAYQSYGKGRHSAKLNMGDCFAYACAKVNNAKLLYKGDDFAKTDLA